MRRGLVLLVTLGLVALAGAGAFVVTGGLEPAPEDVVCTRLLDTCGMEQDEYASCTADMAAWMQRHPVETEGLAVCVTDATSCSGVSGCLAGAGLRSLGAGVGDFFRGMGRALGVR
ncbi:MAG: hypothetical protein H6736_10480 [Alphaproteobacteria bacterium]|nr:hypothetical protein [Alphaproteobacteria bacterium]